MHKQLAKILYEEFDKDDWGDIDPYYFEVVSKGIDPEDDNAEEHFAMENVLKRIVRRLKEIK